MIGMSGIYCKYNKNKLIFIITFFIIQIHLIFKIIKKIQEQLHFDWMKERIIIKEAYIHLRNYQNKQEVNLNY